MSASTSERMPPPPRRRQHRGMTLSSVRLGLSGLIGEVRAGTVDVRTANCLCFLYSSLARAILEHEAQELILERVDRLQDAVARMGVLPLAWSQRPQPVVPQLTSGNHEANHEARREAPER